MTSEQDSHDGKGFWVFRDGRREFNFEVLKSELRLVIAELAVRGYDRRLYLEGLIRCGEIEAALADADSDAAVEFAELATALAAAPRRGDPAQLAAQAERIARIAGPETLSISPPEGFSYYGLRPDEFGECACRITGDRTSAAVVGVRSIGTTLSAVVVSALRERGVRAERISVRPRGHPYDRELTLSPAEQDWVQRARARSAIFLVVDEGPGRSGSTFLATAEALCAVGVTTQDIVLLGSRVPDVEQLCSRDAARRWNSFRFVSATPAIHEQFKNDVYIGSGEWRAVLFSQDMAWPECWPQMERTKFLSPDRQQLFKYEGLGRAGCAAQQRSLHLAESGYGPAMHDAGEGFSAYLVLEGRPLHTDDATEHVLEHLARYSAFRATEFRSQMNSDGLLSKMVAANLACEFGIEAEVPDGIFDTNRPLIVDGRMQPHEWIRNRAGVIFKTDGSLHGDDHFFPGPTDIAWDLAGIVVEWQLETSAREFLLRRFAAITGEDVSSRLTWFVLAYSIFRLGWCAMALPSVRNTPEEDRLRLARERYRTWTKRALQDVGYTDPTSLDKVAQRAA